MRPIHALMIVPGYPDQSKKANFDASHELEELLLEDNPLKARQRKVQDINNLSTEMRQMEEQYVAHLVYFVGAQLTVPSGLRHTISGRCSGGRTTHRTRSCRQPRRRPLSLHPQDQSHR